MLEFGSDIFVISDKQIINQIKKKYQTIMIWSSF